jgi:hypothetical protein
MTSLIRFLVVNWTGGFPLGLVVGLFFIHSNGQGDLLFRQPIAAALLLWGFAASFGMGAIGTALGFLPDDERRDRS